MPSALLARYGWARTVVVLTGWTLLGTGLGQQPNGREPSQPTASPTVPSAQIVTRSAVAPAGYSSRQDQASAASAAIHAVSSESLARFVPVVRITLPATAPDSEVGSEPPVVAGPAQVAALSGSVPVTELPAPLAPETPEPLALVALRPVDVEQVTVDDSPSPHVAQLEETGPPGGSPPLAEKAQVAQISIPERELALLQADAPSQIVVRVADRAIGTVAVRVSEINTVDVQLSGLLDMIAGSFGPEEFARLRGSAAADSYVTLDQLRAAGLGLHYDAVYDELVVGA